MRRHPAGTDVHWPWNSHVLSKVMWGSDLTPHVFLLTTVRCQKWDDLSIFVKGFHKRCHHSVVVVLASRVAARNWAYSSPYRSLWICTRSSNTNWIGIMHKMALTVLYETRGNSWTANKAFLWSKVITWRMCNLTAVDLYHFGNAYSKMKLTTLESSS